MRRAVALVGVIAIVGVALGIMGLLRPVADASEHSAVRSFSADEVEKDGDLTVTIKVAGLGTLGGVVETLPEGFAYQSSTLSPSGVNVEGQAATGQVVSFVPFGEASFEYIVTASGMTGDRYFGGTVSDSGDPADVRLVGGEDKVVVAAAVDGTPEVTTGTDSN